jgi:hypothetical protein
MNLARWWTYQRERFPLAAHAPLVACFSFCAISYSALLRGATAPAATAFAIAFLSSLFSFLHLRIADEFKDFEEDSRHRPYRPVPRGLIKLRELARVWIATAALQIILACLLDWRLLGVLAITWTWLALMSREFFVRAWLKARPVTYLWTHMLIMPLIDLYATACDWMPAQGRLPDGLFWFLVVSFFNGVSIELGRKIRAPGEEEQGVQTYTVLWGRPVAVAAWLGAMLASAAAATAAAHRLGFAPVAATVFAVGLTAGLVAGVRFLRRPEAPRARLVEKMTGLWTMLLYLTLGALPLALRHFD